MGYWQISTSIPENINKGKSSAYYLDTSEQPVDKLHSLIFSVAGPEAGTIIKTMSNSLKHILPKNVKTRVTYTSQQLVAKFQIKDKTKDQHKHALAFNSECPEPTCSEDYLGET